MKNIFKIFSHFKEYFFWKENYSHKKTSYSPKIKWNIECWAMKSIPYGASFLLKKQWEATDFKKTLKTKNWAAKESLQTKKREVQKKKTL